VRQCLERIPKEAEDRIREIVVMGNAAAPTGPAELATLVERHSGRLSLHSEVRSYGYGGDRKAALAYAIREGCDAAVIMRADGTHPPEALPELLDADATGEERAIFASRLGAARETERAAMPWTRGAAHALAHGLMNRTLGLDLRDYTSSFRIYPTRVLRHVPFELNSDGQAFDIQILLQLRALGVPIREVAVGPVWQEDGSAQAGAQHLIRAWTTALDYRLHQLHVTRRGRYLVDRGAFYTLKQSETGSHMQIVAAIRPGSRVLDLGCSQGLLAAPLRERGVTTIGVDAGPPGALREELAEYHSRDLEQPLELPVGRDFDYVVIADVIEHVRNAQQLLRNARRFLKPEGRLLISTPNIALWFYRLSLLVGRFEYGPRGVLDRTHVHLYTRATFRREVERAGFDVLAERYTALPFEVVFESTGRSRLIRRLARAYHGLARLWPEMFAYQVLLEARIRTLDEEATRTL
jgi:2-polyprenyl-3-methyl-5-hydroxy-6-metoxy-1,4-benzoquinol methylase